jgi:hypothetical protein
MVLSGDRGAGPWAGPWAMVLVDGAQKLSGPIESARAWWKEQIAAGWTFSMTACNS